MRSGQSVLWLTVLNAAGGIVGLGNSAVIAYYYGTCRELEVFLAASLLHSLLLALTQSGQLAEILIPIYHKVKARDGSVAAREVFGVVVNWTIAITMCGAVLVWLTAPLMLRLLVPGFNDVDRQLGCRMLRTICPLVTLQVGAALARRLAFAESAYRGAEGVGVAARSLSVASTIICYHQMGVWALVASLWVAEVFVCLGYGMVLRRLGYRHTMRLRTSALKAGELARQLWSSVVYVMSAQVYAFAFNAALSYLPQGTFGVFRYVQMLYGRASSIFLAPVSVVFFTRASEATARATRDWHRLCAEARSRYLAICGVSVCGLIAAAEPLLRGLWKGDLFGETQLREAVIVFSICFGAMPIEALGLVARKAALARGFVSEQYIGAAIAQCTGAVSVLALTLLLGFVGAVSSIVVGSALMAAASLVVVARRCREVGLFYGPRETVLWALAVAAGVCVAWGVEVVVKCAGIEYVGRVVSLALAAGLGGAAMASCLAVAAVCRVREAQRMWSRARDLF